jgi:hypothetical protein
MKKVPVIVKFSRQSPILNLQVIDKNTGEFYLSIDFPNIVDYFEYFGFISAKYDVKSVYFE